MSEPTHELVNRASTGDSLAVDELLERHLPGLRAFIRLRTGRVVRARERESDIVQSTCREVLENLSAFRYGGEAGFRHWLYTTALRKIVKKDEFHRAARRDVRREDGDEQALRAACERIASPSQEAMAAEQLSTLEHAFQDLPEDYREVILLSRVIGLSRAEVAVQMGRTESAVRNLLHRALAQLAQHVDGPRP